MTNSDHLPNLVIAGVSKAGTTSLFAYLAQHPQICPGREKELAYFTPLRHGEPLGPLAEYERAFAHCSDEPFRLEATPNYFFGGKRLIDELDATLPDVRIIVSLRNPVDRLWSSYVMKIRKGHWEPAGSFESFVEQCRLSDAAGAEVMETRRLYKVLSTGSYADYLPLWAEKFGERLRIIFFEQWTRQPALHIAELCRWLEIDDGAAHAIDYRARNQAAIHRSKAVWRVARGVNRALHLKLVSRPQLKRALTNTYKRLNTTRYSSAMDPATRADLEAYYREGNLRLASQLRQLGYASLPPWLEGEVSGASTGASGHSQSNDEPSS
jgi:hypothetical protein